MFITIKELTAAIVVMSAASQASAATVVVNGTFDDTSGWTGTFNAQSGPGGGYPILDTQTYYQGGNNAYNEISQSYALSGAELSSLSSTGLTYSMSADLFGYSTQQDYSTFTAEFLDASLASLGSVSLVSTTNDPGTWASIYTAGLAPVFQSTGGSIDAATTSILFTVSSMRQQGLANDGYLDNAFFELTPSISAVPLPAGMPMLVAGLAGFGVLRRKSR